MSEINVGAISEALNNKVDLPTPSTPQDAVDYVIEMQRPTSTNNYTWYRKYKSGWVEQGGFVTGSGSGRVSVSVAFPITMSDVNYTVATTYRSSTATDTTGYYSYIANMSQTGFTISAYANQRSFWQVSGYAA